LGGKRTKNKWNGMERKDGKKAHILPFRFGLGIDKNGLGIVLENYWLKGFTDDSYRKLLQFHIDNEELTHRLCYLAGMGPILYHGENIKPISTFRRHYEFMIENGAYANNYISSNWHKFPITTEDTEVISIDFSLFYPIYDSYLSIAKGEEPRLSFLVEKANKWLMSNEEQASQESEKETSDDEITMRAREAAESRTRVMPALRWQVFQRDNWKCVSCGRGSQDDVMLQVDHIIPRSKGGKNELSNYQTLCHLCNIGKGNKDDTNLRKQR
jgi:hypothetical protein